MHADRRVRLSWLIPVLALILGAAPPEVVRLRVPQDQVDAVFPLGTDLKRMPANDLEKLLRAAGTRTQNEATPRLLRCRHFAKWVDGMLEGRTELIVAPLDKKTAYLPLEPWTPVVDANSPLNASDDGKLFLRVEPAPGPITMTIPWRLAALPGTHGQKFAIGLPTADLAELQLKLPDDTEPEGPPGSRRGPNQGVWTFLGVGGSFDLQLSGGKGASAVTHPPRIWVEGNTRAEVTETGCRWMFEGTFRGTPNLPRQVEIDLDPRLEVINVSGPLVEGFRSRETDGVTRAVISLRSGGTSALSTAIVIEAVMQVPNEGSWIVPAAVPRQAIWTGGTTTVRLDSSRIIEAITERAGRRVTPRGPTIPSAADGRLLVFDSGRPGPAAEILLRKPWADASASVQGRLIVGNTAPRLSCRIAWKIRAGRLHVLGIDLPTAWVPDHVDIEGSDEPVEWFPETLAGGGVRVHVTSASDDWSEREIELTIAATSSVAGGRGSLGLPRVRPVGVRIADEVWEARAEPGFTLRPTLARGLAWIDPEALTELDTDEPANELDQAQLAWRWTEDVGEGRVERELAGLVREGSVQLVASVSADDLRIVARIFPDGSDTFGSSILIGLDSPDVNESPWRFYDESTGAEIAKRPAIARNHAGPAWSLPVTRSRRGPAAIIARYDGTWRGSGRIPLIVFPDGPRTNGVALVRLARDLRSNLTSADARTLDPDVTAARLRMESPPFLGPNTVTEANSQEFRRANAFTYDNSTHIELQTERLTSTSVGVIREAVLRTHIDPSGSRRDRLALTIVSDPASSLELTLPPGAMLDRIRREGRPVTPARSGESLVIPISPSPDRAVVTIVVEYHSSIPGSSSILEVHPEQPKLSLPCLSVVWEIVAPETWRVVDWGQGWRPADPDCRRPDLFDRLGLSPLSWPARRGLARAARAEHVAMHHELDARATAERHEEISLGEWLLRLDVGTYPLLIDRLALESLGLGPRSRVLPTSPEPSKAGATAEVLRPLGLKVIAVGRALLVTAQEEEVANALAPRWEHVMGEASAWGSDASGRYESVARWREESNAASWCLNHSAGAPDKPVHR